MGIFGDIFNKIFGGPKGPTDTAIPGAMGDLLAQMGITELGVRQRGLPMNVAMGNKTELVAIPGLGAPAFSKSGKPIMAKDRHGRPYQVTENYGVTRKQWKQMQNDEKRKAAGRWYSGEPQSSIDARAAA